MKTVSYLVGLLLLSICSYSQDQLEGRIVNEDNQSIPFASVGIKGKRAGIVSDSSGKFRLNLPGFVKPGDSVIISCIGFQPIRTTVRKAAEQQQFVLQSIPKSLPEITLNSFASSATIGSSTGEFTFYRGWFERKTGGEIGREIQIPHKKFKLDKIFFRADNTCDTCWIRLHIRKMKGDVPGDELLSDNIIVPFTRLSYADQPEFDLTDYNVILTEKRIFIGFEVLSCSNSPNKTSSLCFIGTEYGNYMYKSYSTSQWEDGLFYNIDVSVFLKY